MSLSVLHLRSTTGMYGAEHMLLGLCQEQAKRRCDSTIAAFVQGGQPRPALLTAAAAKGLGWIALPCRGIYDRHCLKGLRALLADPRMGGYDVVHCHDYKSVAYAFMASGGLPQTRVATLHGWLSGPLRLHLYRWLELRLLRAFDRVCAVSAQIEQDLRQAGIPESRIRRVDNGIDTELFVPVSTPLARSARPASLILGIAARLSQEKNLSGLILAVAECKARGRSIQLTIHGEGPLRAELERLVDRLGLKGNVRMPGAVQRLEHWYSTLDALVLPSLSEGMPMTVLEALACGCPVVASAVGAIPDLLAGLPDCRTFPPNDQRAMVEALMCVPMRSSAKLQARTRVVERYSLARMAARYETIYREAMQHNSERHRTPLKLDDSDQSGVLSRLTKPGPPDRSPPAERPRPNPRP